MHDAVTGPGLLRRARWRSGPGRAPPARWPPCGPAAATSTPAGRRGSRWRSSTARTATCVAAGGAGAGAGHDRPGRRPRRPARRRRRCARRSPTPPAGSPCSCTGSPRPRAPGATGAERHHGEPDDHLRHPAAARPRADPGVPALQHRAAHLRQRPRRSTRCSTRWSTPGRCRCRTSSSSGTPWAASSPAARCTRPAAGRRTRTPWTAPRPRHGHPRLAAPRCTARARRAPARPRRWPGCPRPGRWPGCWRCAASASRTSGAAPSSRPTGPAATSTPSRPASTRTCRCTTAPGTSSSWRRVSRNPEGRVADLLGDLLVPPRSADRRHRGRRPAGLPARPRAPHRRPAPPRPAQPPAGLRPADPAVAGRAARGARGRRLRRDGAADLSRHPGPGRRDREARIGRWSARDEGGTVGDERRAGPEPRPAADQLAGERGDGAAPAERDAAEAAAAARRPAREVLLPRSRSTAGSACPTRPAWSIGVHSGGALTMDAWSLVNAWQKHFEGKRLLHGTAHDVLMAAPGLGDYFRAVGRHRGEPEERRRGAGAGRGRRRLARRRGRRDAQLVQARRRHARRAAPAS